MRNLKYYVSTFNYETQQQDQREKVTMTITACLLCVGS